MLVTALASHTNGAVLASLRIRSESIKLYRFLSDGKADKEYERNLGAGIKDVTHIAVLRDQRHYVAGFGYPQGGIMPYITRLHADGTPDQSFVPAPDPVEQYSGLLNHVLLQADDKVIIGGGKDAKGNFFLNKLHRLNIDGSQDATFVDNVTSDSFVKKLALQADGRILVGGNSAINGSVYRLNSNGGLDVSFQGKGLYNNDVYNLLVQADGRILTTGPFTEVDGQPRTGWARLTGAAILKVGHQQATANLEAWPNPVHGQLHLHLDAAAGPRTIELLGMLGR